MGDDEEREEREGDGLGRILSVCSIEAIITWLMDEVHIKTLNSHLFFYIYSCTTRHCDGAHTAATKDQPLVNEPIAPKSHRRVSLLFSSKL